MWSDQHSAWHLVDTQWTAPITAFQSHQIILGFSLILKADKLKWSNIPCIYYILNNFD